ncbi:MAG: nitroreductase family protein [Lactobacillales bacterium]|jgi:nitroreductase|nr:nitroreductase family protein [Lactobacillales bacterium]
MDILKAIHTRRSVRKFTGEPVRNEHIDILLRAAMVAPSAHKRLPWHFIVLTERSALDKVAQNNKYAQMAKEAPLAIIVCADTSLEDNDKGFWVQDCSAAIQNMMLAALELGLGSVWTGIHPTDREDLFRRDFNIPGHIGVLGCVVIGHPAAEQEYKDRYKPERVHQNTW